MALVDADDLRTLAQEAGLSDLSQGAVGSEDEIARTLSRVICESAWIARNFRRPPAKKEKHEWKSLAQRASELAEMLAPRLVSLQSQSLFPPFGKGEVSGLSDDLHKLGVLARAEATRKRPTRPKERPQDWLMAGIAGAYARIAGARPKDDDIARATFARKTLELIVHRMDERWGQEVGKARLSADPGYQSVRSLKYRSEIALGRRMKSGAKQWQESKGKLSFGVN